MYVGNRDLFQRGDGLRARLRRKSAQEGLAGAHLGVVPAVAVGLAKGAVTAVTSIFGGAKDKDPGRLNHIKGLIDRAAAGDRSAWDGPSDSLKYWSTHYATSTAKGAARKAYDALAPLFGDQTGAAPQGPGTITPVQAGFGAGGIALAIGLALMMGGGSKRGRR